MQIKNKEKNVFISHSLESRIIGLFIDLILNLKSPMKKLLLLTAGSIYSTANVSDSVIPEKTESFNQNTLTTVGLGVVGAFGITASQITKNTESEKNISEIEQLKIQNRKLEEDNKRISKDNKKSQETKVLVETIKVKNIEIVEKEIPVEVIKEVIQEVPKIVEKEVPMEVIKVIEKEIIKEVQVKDPTIDIELAQLKTQNKDLQAALNDAKLEKQALENKIKTLEEKHFQETQNLQTKPLQEIQQLNHDIMSLKQQNLKSSISISPMKNDGINEQEDNQSKIEIPNTNKQLLNMNHESVMSIDPEALEKDQRVQELENKLMEYKGIIVHLKIDNSRLNKALEEQDLQNSLMVSFRDKNTFFVNQVDNESENSEEAFSQSCNEISEIPNVLGNTEERDQINLSNILSALDESLSEKLKIELQEKEQEISRLNALLIQQKAQFTTLECEIDILKTNIENKDTSIEKLQERINEIEELKKKIQLIEEENAILKEQNNKMLPEMIDGMAEVVLSAIITEACQKKEEKSFREYKRTKVFDNSNNQNEYGEMLSNLIFSLQDLDKERERLQEKRYLISQFEKESTKEKELDEVIKKIDEEIEQKNNEFQRLQALKYHQEYNLYTEMLNKLHNWRIKKLEEVNNRDNSDTYIQSEYNIQTIDKEISHIYSEIVTKINTETRAMYKTQWIDFMIESRINQNEISREEKDLILNEIYEYLETNDELARYETMKEMEKSQRKNQHLEKILQTQKKEENLVNRNTELEKENTELKSKNLKLEDEINMHKEIKKSFNDLHLKDQAKIIDFEKQRNQYIDTINEKEKIITNLQGQIKNLEKQIHNQKQDEQELEDIQKQLEDKTIKIKTLENIITDLRVENSLQNNQQFKNYDSDQTLNNNGIQQEYEIKEYKENINQESKIQHDMDEHEEHSKTIQKRRINPMKGDSTPTAKKDDQSEVIKISSNEDLNNRVMILPQNYELTTEIESDRRMLEFTIKENKIIELQEENSNKKTEELIEAPNKKDITIEELKRANKLLEGCIVQLKNTLKSSRQEKESLLNGNQILYKEKEELVERIMQMEAEIAEPHGWYEEKMFQQKQFYDKYIDKTNHQIQKLEIHQLEKKYQQQINEYEKQTETLVHNNNVQHKAIEAFSTENQEYTDTNEKLKNDYKLLEEKILELEKTYNDLKQQFNQKSHDYMQQEIKIQELKNLTPINNTLNKELILIQQLEKEISSLNLELDTMYKDRENLLNENDSLIQKGKSLLNDNQILYKEKEELVERIMQMETEITERHKFYERQICEQQNIYDKHSETLQNKIQILASEIKQLTEKQQSDTIQKTEITKKDNNELSDTEVTIKTTPDSLNSYEETCSDYDYINNYQMITPKKSIETNVMPFSEDENKSIVNNRNQYMINKAFTPHYKNNVFLSVREVLYQLSQQNVQTVNEQIETIQPISIPKILNSPKILNGFDNPGVVHWFGASWFLNATNTINEQNSMDFINSGAITELPVESYNSMQKKDENEDSSLKTQLNLVV